MSLMENATGLDLARDGLRQVPDFDGLAEVMGIQLDDVERQALQGMHAKQGDDRDEVNDVRWEIIRAGTVEDAGERYKRLYAILRISNSLDALDLATEVVEA